MISPKKQNPKYDIEFSDGKSAKSYGLILDGTDGSIQQSHVSEDQFAAVIRSTHKKFGDFDEQRNWKAGRGVEYFNLNNDGFWDSKDAWTLSPNHILPTLQYRFAKGLRDSDFNMPGSVTWKTVMGTAGYMTLRVPFTASATYDAKWIYLWVKKIGSPGHLNVILQDSGGGYLQGTGVANTSITDNVSVLYACEITAETLTSGTSYKIEVYGNADDNKTNHWEVACDATVAGEGKAYVGDYGAITFSPYYRITDEDVDRKFFGFNYFGAKWIVDKKANGSASQLYINGDKGFATSATSTTIVDSTKSWVADRYIGAWVYIYYGTGEGQYREITDNTTTTLTVSPAWDVNPAADDIFVIYSTDWWTEITGHGLGVVQSKPCVINGICYFPQGTTAIRSMCIDISDGSMIGAAEPETASFLVNMHSSRAGVSYMCGANSGLENIEVSLAEGVDFTDYQTAPATAQITYIDDIKVGDYTRPITGLCSHEDTVYVFKEDGVFRLVFREKLVSGDTTYTVEAEEVGISMRNTPSPFNGLASASHGLDVYFSWKWSTERLHGDTLDDIGPDWSGSGMPDGRHGNIEHYESVIGWLFAALNAGTGTSSVLCWDGLGWHEILRGFANREITGVTWQACTGTRDRLWTFIGGDVIFQEFPLNTASPLRDSGVLYQHEAVVESSIIDMGTASRLPKYIKKLTAITENLSTAGMFVGVDYQTDKDVHTSNWITVSRGLFTSPEDDVDINEADIRQFVYRLRLNTNDNTTPVDVRSIVPSGFARVPWRRVWNVRVKTGSFFDKSGAPNISQDDLLKWIEEAASIPGRITMRSNYRQLHGKHGRTVIISPPTLVPKGKDKGTMTLSIMEI